MIESQTDFRRGTTLNVSVHFRKTIVIIFYRPFKQFKFDLR